jgi:YesN/AraC family two-component response regulator
MLNAIPKYYLYKRIVKSKIYIDQHFKENMTVDQLAKISCFSTYHFIKLFKEAYDITPKQYLISKRFEAAKKMLAHSDSIFDICCAVGYESPNTFTYQFKKLTGLPPSDFRKKILQKENKEKGLELSFIPQCFFQTI